MNMTIDQITAKRPRVANKLAVMTADQYSLEVLSITKAIMEDLPPATQQLFDSFMAQLDSHQDGRDNTALLTALHQLGCDYMAAGARLRRLATAIDGRSMYNKKRYPHLSSLLMAGQQ